MTPAGEAASILDHFGVDAFGGGLPSYSPIDGTEIGRVRVGDAAGAATKAVTAFEAHRPDVTLLDPHLAEASWFVCWAKSFAPRRSHLRAWSRSKAGRSSRKASARSRR